MTFLDNTGLAYFWSKLKALFATKSELEVVRQSASKAYHYKGSVADIASLPANAEQGDVYNVGNTLDGDNYAWTGTAWDKLGASVDLSAYAVDANVVHKTDNEEIGGGKTFTAWTGFNSTSGDNRIFSTPDTSSLRLIAGGNGTSSGGQIGLFGGSHASYPGQFRLIATDGTNTKVLVGKFDGTLTWDAKDIITNGGDQTVSGVKTFTSSIITDNDIAIKRDNNSGAVRIAGGTGVSGNEGAYLALFGASHASNPGYFRLYANGKKLEGTPAGVLTWNNKDIAIDENVVHKTGDETIADFKVFTDNLRITGVSFSNINQNIVKGTIPSSDQNRYIYFFDKVDDPHATFFGTAHVMAAIKNLYAKTSGNNSLQLIVYTPTTGGTSFRLLSFRATPAGEYAFLPGTNNNIDLGDSSNRWKEIWCNQSSINTSSDERIKQQIDTIPDAVLDAWDDVNWIQFKYNDACKEKGTDKARLHNGLIAQHIDEAFKAHGLDASKYGLFLYDEWEAQPEEKDEEGNVIQPAQPAGNAYGIRYTEALCMEAAYQRRRADRAERDVADLTQRLNELEARFAVLEAKLA